MRFNDAVFGIVLIVFALAIIGYARTFPEMPGQAYGPALFPNIIGAGFIICGVVLTVRGLRAYRATGLGEFAGWASDPVRLFDGALVPLALAVYILAADWLGFLPTAFILLSALFLRYGARPLVALPVAIVVTLVVHALFTRLLLVPLPWGLLEEFAW